MPKSEQKFKLVNPEAVQVRAHMWNPAEMAAQLAELKAGAESRLHHELPELRQAGKEYLEKDFPTQLQNLKQYAKEYPALEYVPEGEPLIIRILRWLQQYIQPSQSHPWVIREEPPSSK